MEGEERIRAIGEFTDEEIAEEAQRRFVVPILWDRDDIAGLLDGWECGEGEWLVDEVERRARDASAYGDAELGPLDEEWVEFLRRIADAALSARNAAEREACRADAPEAAKEAAGHEVDGYERYRLEWMLAHGCTLPRLLRELQEHRGAGVSLGDYREESLPSFDRMFSEWEFDRGFDGELWASRAEWEGAGRR